MPICPTCRSNQPDGVAFCDECGASLAAVAMPTPATPAPAYGGQTVLAGVCPTCGTQVLPDTTFCPTCGATLDGQGAPAAAASSAAYPPGGGATCPTCGAQLEPGSVFCDMCGGAVGQAPPAQPYVPAPTPPPSGVPDAASNWGAPAAQQYPYQQPGLPPNYPPSAPQAAGIGAGYGAVRGRLIVEGANAPLPFPGGKSEVFVGREDPISGYFPDLDLTNHGGDEGGVSRKHARIFAQGNQMMIEDLGSTNFTFVNQQKLVPHQPQPLNDGDGVRFGRVKATYYA
ncbi:MAG: Double zinc ribbon [Chloroflexi bacterium ADurb.Bin360]|nr:MAG: Double zinc ribbon [Chloroflexi bacterium ADurb.Bin360]